MCCHQRHHPLSIIPLPRAWVHPSGTRFLDWDVTEGWAAHAAYSLTTGIDIIDMNRHTPIPQLLNKFWASEENKQNIQLLARDMVLLKKIIQVLLSSLLWWCVFSNKTSKLLNWQAQSGSEPVSRWGSINGNTKERNCGGGVKYTQGHSQFVFQTENWDFLPLLVE